MDEVELEESGGGGAGWMATFADMMTLLLTFFVLLLSFATMDIVKFEQVMGSIKEALGVQFVHDGTLEAVATSPIQLFDTEAPPNPGMLEDTAILEQLKQAISEQGLDEVVEAEQNARGVLVRMTGGVLYPLGEAALKAEAEPLLDEVVSLFMASESPIMIEGHTDDLPISTAQFPSNWELSVARAISAMRYFVDHGVPAERIGVAGYAGLRPVVANESPETRARNRRVEFLLVRSAPTEVG